MREILFRGKQTDKDKWVYGVPIKGTNIDESEVLIIESVYNCDEYVCRGCEFAPVIPESVSEFTGVTDKNGKKIFEGDIVEEGCNGLVGVVIWDNSKCTYGLKDFGESYKIEDAPIEWEVIGNLHDNPELLKGGGEG